MSRQPRPADRAVTERGAPTGRRRLAAGAGTLARRPELLALALAAPAAWALPRLLGLPPAGRLGPTVAVVPLVVAGLIAVEAAARRVGARRTPPALRWAVVLGLLGWLLLVAARPRLGLPLPPQVLAAALFALLACHLAALVPRLRPLLGSRLAPTPHPAFFWLPLLAYVAILPWSTSERPPDGDEPYYLLVAHSLAYDGDADLRNNYAAGDSLRFMKRRLEPQPGDPVGGEGQLYSRHNVLLPLLLAGPYRLDGARGASLVMALLTALLCWWTLRLARERLAAHPSGALLAWALLAFAPPLLLYSHQIWVEVPAALLVLVALDALPEPGGGGRRGRPWLFAAALVLLPLLKLRFAVFAASLMLLAWWRLRRRRRVLWSLAALPLLLAAILVYNHAVYGNALKTYALRGLFDDRPLLVAARAVGLFFDAAFGLFAVAPLWALLLPAALLLVRLRHPLLFELLPLAVPYLTLVIYRREWYGGWSPPFRYGIPLLPLLALALVPLLARRRSGGARLVLAALATTTLAFSLLWLAVPGWTYNVADGGNHLLDLLARQLQLDLARLFPTGLLVRPASWWWALALAVALPLLWWRPRRFHPALPALGITLVLLAPAAALLAAARLPTRVVEMEDPQVSANGGYLFPSLWTYDRLLHRAGWVIQEGVAVTAPVVAGGAQVELVLVVSRPPRAPRQGLLVLRAGERELGRVLSPRSRHWRRLALGPYPWPAGAPLVVALERMPDGEGQRAVVAIDRVELRWR